MAPARAIVQNQALQNEPQLDVTGVDFYKGLKIYLKIW
jgi:hypothetical protein